MAGSRFRLIRSACLAAALAIALPAAGTILTPLQLSNNGLPDGRPQVSEPNVTWQGGTALTEEIRFFDGLASQNLTANAIRDFHPQISGTNVIWKHSLDSFDCELRMWDGATTSTVESSFECVEEIRIGAPHVIWGGRGPNNVADVFLFSGTQPPDEFGEANFPESQPRVSDVAGSPRAVWVNEHGAFYYDGTNPPTQVFTGDAADPEIDGADAVFAASDGSDFEIWITDGTTTTQITDNGVDDVTPDVANGNVVWVSQGEIMLWDGASTVPLTADALDDRAPRISTGVDGTTVAWVKDDGSDDEVWVFDSCETSAVTDDGNDDDQVALDGNTVAWRSGSGLGSEVWQAFFECDAVCGDGVLEPPAEECDDANTTDGDGCDASCTLEVCGNGVLQVGEECDDGNTTALDGCDAGCLLECGNGVVDPIEECDDGNRVDGDGCDSGCLIEVCGNGRLEANEECDDGNTTANDGCDSSCLLECGNGMLEPAEGCDDGNVVPGDGCDENCVAEVCGNGVLQAGEECDDGNVQDSDGCSSLCQVEAPPSAAQQKCINELNKRGAKLVKVQNKASFSCLKSAGKGAVAKLGTPATAQDCLTNDVGGKIASASAKTVSGEAKKCDPADLPAFGYTDSGTVAAAGVAEAVAQVGDVFGPDLDVPLIDASADKAGAKCQQEVLKRTNKLMDTLFKQTNKEKKKLLAGKPDGTTALSGPVLQMQLLGYIQADAKGKFAKAEGKTSSKTASKCAGVNLSTAFPGCAVASVGPLADCANATARCRFCRALNAMDGLAMDCDDVDNGAADASCP